MRVILTVALISTSAAAGSPQLKALQDLCANGGQGKMIWLQSSVQTGRPEWLNRINTLSLPSYCGCYFDELVLRYGEARALELESFRQPKLDEVVHFMEQKDAVQWHCLGKFLDGKPAEIPSPTSARAPATSAETPGYLELMRSKVRAGGVGKLSLGMSLKNVIKELGPCPAVNHNKTIDSYFYGPNRIELEVKIDTNTQRVVGLAVDQYFTGATEEGVGIGTPVAKVLAAYGDRAPPARQSILREGGVWFGFDTAGKVDRMWLQEAP